MTTEQFIYWLRGYLESCIHANTDLSQSDVERILEEINHIKFGEKE